MSVSTTASQVTYAGNASTSAAYPTTFPFFDATDLSVVVNTDGVPTTLALGSGYSVTGGAGTTGSITTTSAVPSTSTVIITRSTAKTQLTSYTTGDRFPASAQEKALDKLTLIAQEATAIPGTATASGAAPYVLQAASAGATPAWVPQSSGGIAAGAITNTMLAGGITPAKLSTGAPVWDASGNLTATSFVGNITGSITGNAATATKLATPRLVSLSGDVTGSASFDGSSNATIAATIASVGTSQIANNAITSAKLGTNEQKQIAKAWVNFNGTTASPSTIRSSYNVSSITKNGAGDYTVNFSTAMADANYSTGACSIQNAGVSGMTTIAEASRSTSSLRIGATYAGWQTSYAWDAPYIGVQVFGN